MKRSCEELRVQSLREQGEGIFELVLASPAWDGYVPGQFVMIKPSSWNSSPLLPRPFSIADLDDQGLHIYFQVAGRGTAKMTRLGIRDKVVTWGPLGRGFQIPEKKPCLLLAGGMGLAPFVGLAKKLSTGGNHECIFGHRLGIGAYPFARIKEALSAEHHQQETMAEIEAFLGMIRKKMTGYAGSGQAMACGPEPFLRAVQTMALELGVKTQLSLEKRMACGVGACLGCAVHKKGSGLVQSCTQGPVFWADEIVL